jgi:hypothetical protein
MQKKDRHQWTDPNPSHEPRPKRRLENPDVFFTLKVYSQISGRNHRSLKFTVDFDAPFQPNTDPLEPYYVSVTDENNLHLFQEILEHVSEVYRYISDPVNYQPKDGAKHPLTESKTRKGEKPDPDDRRTQQETLAEILKLTKGRINQFFYEQGSTNRVGVSAVALTDGNGDPRPPRAS